MVAKERNGLSCGARRVNPRIGAGQHHAHQLAAAGELNIFIKLQTNKLVVSGDLAHRDRNRAGLESQLNLFDFILQVTLIRRAYAAAAMDRSAVWLRETMPLV